MSSDQSSGHAEGGTDGPQRSPLSTGEVFEILSNSRRRQLVRQLREYDGEVGFKELYERLAAREVAERSDGDTTVEYQDRKRVYVSLRQTHLPRLAEAGVLEYDDEASTVAPEPPAEVLWEVLDRVDRTCS